MEQRKAMDANSVHLYNRKYQDMIACFQLFSLDTLSWSYLSVVPDTKWCFVNQTLPSIGCFWTRWNKCKIHKEFSQRFTARCMAVWMCAVNLLGIDQEKTVFSLWLARDSKWFIPECFGAIRSGSSTLGWEEIQRWMNCMVVQIEALQPHKARDLGLILMLCVVSVE